MRFYKADSSDPLGYSLISFRTESCVVDPDGLVLRRNPSSVSYSLGSDMCSVMNFPFYVFNNVADMENYLKTGEVNNVFTSNSGFLTSLGEESGLDPGLQGEGIALTNSAVVLPADLSEAAARVEAFQKPLSRDELMAMLAADGFSAVKGVSYKVGHYRESTAAGADGEPVWENYLEETFYGAPGADASFTPLDLEGYTYAPELTEPEEKEILEDGSLVIRLYYTLDRVPYTIKYYKDGECFETVSGTVPMVGDRMVRDYKDFCPQYYLLDSEASTPLPFEVSESNCTIHVYYEKDLDAVLPYTVEYHKEGEVFKTASGAVPVFGEHIVRECEDFCPQYYLPDNKTSTPLPFEVSELDNTIHIYYKRDVYATFPYTVEYYQDGELFKTVPGSVSVFNPFVKSCISYCPKGYVLDTTSSTALPFEVSDQGGVVKNYYVRQDTVFPYTVEYYKDGLRTSAFSGNVPSASPLLQSFPSRCPEYYKLDQERSTPMPYTVPEGGGRIKVYYKKDEGATFPYTVECYKDGELVETVSKTVSVFDPAVEEYGFDCPEGYVVDTSSSTYLPYSVSKDSNVIRYYYVDEGKSLPYTVEYYKDGKEFSTLSGNVPVTSPVVNSYWPYCPDGYIQDEASSDTLPFTVTKDNNVIRTYYIPDPSNPYTSFTGGVTRLVNFVIDFLGKAILWLFILVMLYLFIDKNLVLVKRITSRIKSKEPKQKKKKKLFTAPKSRFMKGVHTNRSTSLKSKANMKHRERIYIRPDLRRPRSSHKQNGLGM